MRKASLTWNNRSRLNKIDKLRACLDEEGDKGYGLWARGHSRGREIKERWELHMREEEAQKA